MSRKKRSAAGRHLAEAIKHLEASVVFVRDQASRDDSETPDKSEHLIFVIEDAIATIRDAFREVEGTA